MTSEHVYAEMQTRIPVCPMCGRSLVMKNSMNAFGYYCEHCKSWKVLYKKVVK